MSFPIKSNPPQQTQPSPEIEPIQTEEKQETNSPSEPVPTSTLPLERPTFRTPPLFRVNTPAEVTHATYIEFSLDEAEIDKTIESQIEEQARYVLAHGLKQVTITGHTHDVSTGIQSAPYLEDQTLAHTRASRVQEYFVQCLQTQVGEDHSIDITIDTAHNQDFLRGVNFTYPSQ